MSYALRSALVRVTDVLDKFGDLSDDLMDPRAWRMHEAEEAITEARAVLAASAPVVKAPVAEKTGYNPWANTPL